MQTPFIDVRCTKCRCVIMRIYFHDEPTADAVAAVSCANIKCEDDKHTMDTFTDKHAIGIILTGSQ